MYGEILLILVASVSLVYGQSGRCDQTPVGATVLTPSDTKDLPFSLKIKTNLQVDDRGGTFYPDQTYVLILETMEKNRPFKEFMITVEDPRVDDNVHSFRHDKVDVGLLKILEDDNQSRHSERCHSSVENKDSSDKHRIEIHWVSPKQSDKGQKVRFRAMVAENKATWYTGKVLSITLEKDDAKAKDSPPLKPKEMCNVCSEARYEVIFKGMWSRGTHPYRYPAKPDENKYSHMVGASHAYNFTLWELDTDASDGLKLLAEDADISILERDIISAMQETGGTRTLIRGKGHKHPYMSEPSHALFRVDRYHHMFSLLVAMKPSPDWFLGTSRFELCTQDDDWLEQFEIPMYPFDAGTMDGISYDDTPRSVTNPRDKVGRVAVGSFNKESPFYQMNLNDLKPFAMLEVRRLDVYLPVGPDCQEARDACLNDEEQSKEDQGDEEEDMEDEPLAESWIKEECSGQWSQWSACVADDGDCGAGIRTRTRYHQVNGHHQNDDPDVLQVRPLGSCHKEQETQYCFVNCY